MGRVEQLLPWNLPGAVAIEVVETATEPAVKVTIETVKPEPNKK